MGSKVAMDKEVVYFRIINCLKTILDFDKIH